LATIIRYGPSPDSSRRRSYRELAANYNVSIATIGEAPRLINPEVWPAYQERFERIMGFAPEA
jgi:hypothetical protein